MKSFETNHIEILVEEPSAEAALINLIPKILNEEISFKIHVFEGKKDLINKLSSRFKGYRRWIPDDWLILVFIDNDNDDCSILKKKLEDIATSSNLSSKSSPNIHGKFKVINRIVIEELEAWLFGDTNALNMAYPMTPKNLHHKKRFRDPDSIKGGTWEALEKLLQKSGYYRSGMPKIEVARNVSKYMDPQKNRSKSFQLFRDTLYTLSSK